MMGDLSKHLSRREIACPCGCGFDTFDHELDTNIEALCDTFLALSDTAVRVVLHINSGNRCPAYDRELKIRLAREGKYRYDPDKKPSEHLKSAIDFWMEYEYPDGERRKIDDDLIADELEMEYVARHGVGRYNGRTHYDCRRNGPARWDNR